MPSSGESLKVAVRVRPFNQRELRLGAKCVVSMQGNSTTITHPNNHEKKQFSFDCSYWSHDGFTVDDDGKFHQSDESTNYADQMKVFDELGQGVLQNAWEGYNATLFAYGQTGSGKSYSMIGYGNNKGIVPITCGNLFQVIDDVKKNDREFQVSFSMLEIYNEQIRDLLGNKNRPKSTNLKVREDKDVGFYVEGLSQHPCRDYGSIEYLMEVGAINRTTAATNMNATSSRSHMLITIKFMQIFKNELGESTTKTSEINLVDLAGSERADSSGATGDRLKEGSAINRSLLMLGSVIETLAAGDVRAVVPYRDSVLTKLLKSALGGNSKTVMIAALSPADVNYEETLSTLRYANRAKKIKNKAVVNESSTDKLIRKLREENARLLAQLSGYSPQGGSIDKCEVQRMIKINDQQMKEMMMTWEQKLEFARKEWEAEYKKTEEKDKSANYSYPYLQNVNEDPQLNGIIKHVIYDGVTMVGRGYKEKKGRMKEHFIELRGLGVQEEHFLIRNSDDCHVIIELCDGCDVMVNGVKILIQTSLRHGDRIKFGSNTLFLFIGFPRERTLDGSNSVTTRHDYQFFQNELMSHNTGINHDLRRHNCDIDEVYLEYIKFVAVVESINDISKELGKEIHFELFVKNFATYDIEGSEIPKEVAVKVRHLLTKQVWIWSKTKLMNRRYLIEELYVRYLDDSSSLSLLSRELDPFWDPVEDIYLGCAHAWLHSLMHCISFDDQIPFNNHSGEEEGLIHLSISSSTSDQCLKEDTIVIDPNELIGKSLDILIQIEQCFGIKWIKEDKRRGIMLRFKFYDKKSGHTSSPCWKAINPKIGMKQHITVECVDSTFLRYLHSSALIIELWGLQEGRLDDPNLSEDDGFIPQITSSNLPLSSPTTTSTTTSTTSDVKALEHELETLKKKLKQSNDDNDDLIRICNILKNQNLKLRRKRAAKTSTSSETSMTSVSDGNHINHHLTPVNHPSKGIDLKSSGNIDAHIELCRALKSFFIGMLPMQQELEAMSRNNAVAGNLKLMKVSKNLDSMIERLKQVVSATARTQRSYSAT